MPKTPIPRNYDVCHLSGRFWPPLLHHQSAPHSLQVCPRRVEAGTWNVQVILIRPTVWQAVGVLLYFLFYRLFPFFFYGNVAASLMNMVAITINRWVIHVKFYLLNRICLTPVILRALLLKSVKYLSKQKSTFSQQKRQSLFVNKSGHE